MEAVNVILVPPAHTEKSDPTDVLNAPQTCPYSVEYIIYYYPVDVIAMEAAVALALDRLQPKSTDENVNCATVVKKPASVDEAEEVTAETFALKFCKKAACSTVLTMAYSVTALPFEEKFALTIWKL